MSHSAFVLAIIVLTVVAPLALLLHYITRWKEAKGLSKEDERMLEDLWQSAERMESRINALETILDEGTDGWRKKI